MAKNNLGTPELEPWKYLFLKQPVYLVLSYYVVAIMAIIDTPLIQA